MLVNNAARVDGKGFVVHDGKGFGKQFKPTIPLEKVQVEYSKANYVVIKIKTIPEEAASPSQEVQMPYFKDGTPDQLLDFLEKLTLVMKGQLLTTGVQKFGLTRTLLQGDALTTFNNRAAVLVQESTVNFTRCIQYLKYHVFPKRGLRAQTRYMRRYMRKPANMTFKQYVARVIEMNTQLKDYPDGFINQAGHATGFNVGQKLSDDELLDILEFGIPNSWQKTMIELGIETMDGTAEEGLRLLSEFCERREFTESLDSTQPGQKPTTQKSVNHGQKSVAKSSAEANKAGTKKRKTSYKTDESKWCPLHRTHGHNSDECKIIQDQVKKMRGQWDGTTVSSYERKNNERREQNKQRDQLRVSIESMVAKAMTGKSGKRKKGGHVHYASGDKEEEDSSASEDEEQHEETCHQFEGLSVSKGKLA